MIGEMTRQELAAKAHEARGVAVRHHEQGDRECRDILLRQAARWYDLAGLPGMAAWCVRFAK